MIRETRGFERGAPRHHPNQAADKRGCIAAQMPPTVPRPVIPQPGLGTGSERSGNLDRARHRPRYRAIAVALATLLVPLVADCAATAASERSSALPLPQPTCPTTCSSRHRRRRRRRRSASRSAGAASRRSRLAPRTTSTRCTTQGFDGRGMTIAIVDSFGSDTMAHDLHVYDQAFGLPPMCGEEGVTCAPGMPTFSSSALPGLAGDQGAAAEARAPARRTRPRGRSRSRSTSRRRTPWRPARTSCSSPPRPPRRSACRASRR